MVAEPSDVVAVTLVAAAAAGERLTVKVSVVVPAFPSAWETFAMENVGVGESSFWMLPSPCVSEIPPFTPFVRFTAKNSGPSLAVSPFTVTPRGWLVIPGRNVSVPDLAT